MKSHLLGIALLGVAGALPAHANSLDRLQQQRSGYLQQQRDKATHELQDIQWRQLVERQNERINQRQKQIEAIEHAPHSTARPLVERP